MGLSPLPLPTTCSGQRCRRVAAASFRSSGHTHLPPGAVDSVLFPARPGTRSSPAAAIGEQIGPHRVVVLLTSRRVRQLVGAYIQVPRDPYQRQAELELYLRVEDQHPEALTLQVWRSARDDLAPLAGLGSEEGHQAPHNEHAVQVVRDNLVAPSPIYRVKAQRDFCDAIELRPSQGGAGIEEMLWQRSSELDALPGWPGCRAVLGPAPVALRQEWMRLQSGPPQM